MKGVAPAVRRGLGGVDGEARTAGRQFGQVFSKAASDAADVGTLGKKTAAATSQASRASRELTAARKAEKDATQTVGVAEARLAELRSKGNAKTSQLLAAEQRVDRARAAQSVAQDKVARAYDAEFVAKGKAASASRAHAQATQTSTAQVGRASGVFQRLGLDLNQSKAKMEENRQAMARLAGSTGAGALAGIGPSIKLGLAGALGSVAASAVKLEASYSQTMNLVKASTGVGAAEMARMDALAIKLGQDTSFSANEAAQAMLALAKAGVKPATIETGALAATLTQAAASGDDLEASANAIGNALNMFSLKGEDAGKVAAAFAGGANASTAEVKDLTLGLAQVGPGAAAAGQSINDVVGTLAAFNNAGLRGSDAGTSLKQMFASLVPATDPAGAAMESLGLYSENAGKQIEFLEKAGIKFTSGTSSADIKRGFTELARKTAGAGASTAELSKAYADLVVRSNSVQNAFFDSTGKMKSATEIAQLLQDATKNLSDEERTYALNKIFGSDASRAANILAKEGAAGLAKYIDATKDAGAAQNMANARMAGTAGALERLSGSWETLRLNMGRAFAPFVQVGANVLAGTMGVLGDHLNVILPALGTLVVTIGAYKVGVAAAATYTKLMTLWTERQTIAQYALNLAMKLSTVGLIVAGVAALIAGFVLLYNKSETVRNVLNAVGAAFVTVGGFIGSVFTGAVSAAVTGWGALTDAVSRGWAWMNGNVFKPFTGTVSGPLTSMWGTLSSAASTAWAAITGAVSTAWGFLRGVFDTLRNTVGVVLSTAFRFFSMVARNAWELIRVSTYNAWQIVKAIFGLLADWLGPILGSAWRAFSGVVLTVWNTVRGAITTAWNWILTRVFTPIRNWLVAVFATAWRNFSNNITFIWNTVRNTISTIWTWIMTRVFTPIRDWLVRVFTQAFAAFRNAAMTVWTVVRNAITAAWGWILTRVFQPLRNWLGPIFSNVFGAFQRVAGAVWGAVTGVISRAWGNINRTFDALKRGLTAVRDWFGVVIGRITAAWNSLKEKIAAPIRFVVNTVIRDKLLGAWNAIASRVNLAKFNITPMWTGGRVPGWSPNDRADNIPAMLTADEHVIRQRAARRMRRRHPGALEYINAHGALPGYAQGGPVGYARGGMVYPSMVAWLRKNIPGIAITSTYRPGSITASGNRSYHSMGKAVDMTPSMAIFNKILATFGSSIAELIYSPAGYRQIKNGRPYLYQGAVRSMHYNHVHWAQNSPVGNVPPGSAEGLPLDGYSVANPIAEFLKGVISPLFTGARKLIDGATGLFGSSEYVTMIGKFAKLPVDAAEKWLREKIDAVFPGLAGPDASGTGDLPKSSGPVRKIVQEVAARRNWGAGPNWDALQYIIGRESSWNPNAVNPTSGARGLFQFMAGTWAGTGIGATSDPALQAEAGMRYIKSRYGSPINARAFWMKNHWYGEGGRVEPVNVAQYDAGGILRPGLTLARNDTGRPETIRTWEQEQALQAGGTNITINGIRYDSIGEFASELNFALARASSRSRYAGVA